MRPAFAASSKELAGEVRYAVVNADTNRGLARRFNIQALPTLKYYSGGYGKTQDNAHSYMGGRTQREITNYSRQLLDEYNRNPDKPTWFDPAAPLAESEE